MTEAFLQFIWQQQLFDKNDLRTTDDEKIGIIHQGFKNSDAGPDFYNAKIRVGEQLWAGTVEIHVKSSDWYKHNHSVDKAYDNVILHVVDEFDTEIFNFSGVKIPTFILKYDKALYEKYMRLIMNKGPIPCSDFIEEIDEFYIQLWQNSLLVQRLHRKSEGVLKSLQENDKSWEETFYQHLAENFGFKVNALPFRMLSKSLPYKVISKQKDDLLQIEALLFGQAGFLNEKVEDKYFNLLKREYDYLCKKYDLKSIENHLWKFLRLRPVNFPTIRIAQFAKILHDNVNLFSKIIETEEVSKIRKFFEVEVSEYWQNHYKFGKASKKSVKKFGNQSINGVLINTVSLFLFAYGDENRDEKFKERALELLENQSAENNSIIRKWESTSIKIKNSFQSQAMIELHNEFCKKGRCLECNIGSKIIIKEKY